MNINPVSKITFFNGQMQLTITVHWTMTMKRTKLPSCDYEISLDTRSFLFLFNSVRSFSSKACLPLSLGLFNFNRTSKDYPMIISSSVYFPCRVASVRQKLNKSTD